MRTPACLTNYALPTLLLALGCGPDGGVADPATPSGSRPSLASARYSAWSDPRPLESVNEPDFIDQQPALSKDLSLYFASNRPTNLSDNVLDLNIWVARYACTDQPDQPDQCSWSNPVEVPAVNSDLLDASPSLSRDGHQLFFSSQRPHSHCSPPSTQCTNRDLWVSYREDVHDDFGWGEAANLGGGINSPAEEVAPSYFENEDAGVPQLFLNRGAVGGDIYVSEMRDGTWGAPALVNELNISATNQRPSISHDGLEIYFWSDKEGTGDLWVAGRETVSSSWSTPVRVVFPTSGQQPAIMPFIHSHGKTETLLFVRPFLLTARDLWITERTRLVGPE
jgi:hypothetical protein